MDVIRTTRNRRMWLVIGIVAVSLVLILAYGRKASAPYNPVNQSSTTPTTTPSPAQTPANSTVNSSSNPSPSSTSSQDNKSALQECLQRAAMSDAQESIIQGMIADCHARYGY